MKTGSGESSQWGLPQAGSQVTRRQSGQCVMAPVGEVNNQNPNPTISPSLQGFKPNMTF
jgi:hypothetical protein